MEDITFTVSVGNKDWENDLGAWRCSALKIPTSTVNAVYFNGQKVDDKLYTVDKKLATIFWASDRKPEQVSISITLNGKLSIESDTLKWKKLAIILPLITAIITAIIALFSANLNMFYKHKNSYNSNSPKLDFNELGIVASFKLNSNDKDYILSEIELKEILKDENIEISGDAQKNLKLKFEFSAYQLRTYKGFKFKFGSSFYKKLGTKYMFNDDWYAKPLNDNVEFSLIRFDNRFKFFETDINV